MLENSICNHRFRASQSLLCWLKDQLDSTPQVIFVSIKHFCDRQANRGMPIMATGVHDSWSLRGIFRASFFLDRKRIHIKAYQHDWSRPGSLQGSHYASFTNSRAYLQTQFNEITGYDAGCAHLLKP